MSAKCPLNCSAVELWYKIMLEIRNQSDLTENNIKRKAAGCQRLSSNWLWLLMAVYKPLLSDAKMLKYILKHHIIGNFPRYIRNKENAFPYILRKKIPGDMRIKTILNSMDSIQSFA